MKFNLSFQVQILHFHSQSLPVLGCFYFIAHAFSPPALPYICLPACSLYPLCPLYPVFIKGPFICTFCVFHPDVISSLSFSHDKILYLWILFYSYLCLCYTDRWTLSSVFFLYSYALQTRKLCTQ